MATATARNGGEILVNYMLMPLTAEETIKGGECLSARYAREHQSRWININNCSFDMQTYDRGYTRIRVNGRAYQVHQDVLESDLAVRLYIGKYIGTAREDDIGGIQTMEDSPKNIYTWKELVTMGVVTDAADVVINYSKLLTADKKTCLIGGSNYAGVRLVIPEKTSNGITITTVSCSDAESEWSLFNFAAKYICDVELPSTLKNIGGTKSAFPMLGRNVMSHRIDLKIPKNVNMIGIKAFYGANIKTISGSLFCAFTSEDALAIIKESAFEGCTNLGVIHLGTNVKTLERKAFANCEKAQIHLTNKITTVADDACYNAGDVEFNPRLLVGEPIPDIVKKAPFGARLWNGKRGNALDFYSKLTVLPPSIIIPRPPMAILPLIPRNPPSDT